MDLDYLHTEYASRLTSDKDFQSRLSLCSAESKHVAHIDR